MSSGIESFRGRSFLSTGDFSRADLAGLLDLAVQQKYGRIKPGHPLAGKSVALVFFNPSLRTRTSMAVAVQQLGGFPIVLDVGRAAWPLEFLEGVVMDQDKAEHIKEAAPVLSTYVDAVGVRCFPAMEDYEEDVTERVLRSFDRYTTVPVINLESSTEHPLQGLADIMTIKEKFGTVDQRKVVLCWAYHPKALPMSVANSFALAATQYGMHLTICCPPGFELTEEKMERIEKEASGSQGSVRLSQDPGEACDGAEIVYAKSWGSAAYYGRWDEEKQLREQYRDWIVSSELMDKTANGYFLHCLPVRRNVVVTDAVLDGPRSLVVEQSANRLHIQKTLLSAILS